MNDLDAVIEGTEAEGTSYADALTGYLARLNAAEAERFERSYPNLEKPVHVVEKGGRKYDRVVREDGDGCGRSVVSFVERETGLIWKADSWRGPKRNFPRGSVYALPERPAGAIADPVLSIAEARW